jgi:hypothetical protein
MTLLVKGGPAGSGSKRPLAAPRAAWRCSNGHENRGFAVRCLTFGCNEKRDAGR